MPRSAIDATRFTATSPHAYSKISNSPAFPPQSSSAGNRNETPLEKVARLRNASRQEKLSRISRFDLLVDRGRIWADRAHRITALTLIAASGVAGIVTVYALGDMIIYNRRKRKAFFAEQKRLHASALQDASEAMQSGTASKDQILYLNRESMLRQAELAKEQRGGVFKRTARWLFSGFRSEDTQLRLNGD